MDFENKYVDELIEIRKEARQNKDWKLCDEIRNYLDIKLVFIFDTKAGQEIYYLFEEYFKNKENKIETFAMSNRQYIEYRIQQEIRHNNNFNAWLYSQSKIK